MQRYFIEQSQIQNQSVEIDGGDYHHIKNVMRLIINDKVIVNTYNGQVFLCRIVEFQKNVVLLKIIKEMPSENNHLNLDLGLSLTKKDSFELALKKTTELGVSGIIPIETERSVVKIKDFQKKKDRFTLICKESSEQSERTTLPTIYDLQTLDSLDLKNYDHLFVAFAREENKQLKTYFSDVKKDETTLILVGPEGGFSNKEINLLMENGFKTISLGNTILRAETAAIYITSIFRYMMGE
ncbi:MAG: RsmE family RNA methyltransferase [Tenericutes bacterium]|jgi:16S rRNA (uracil1498-N3)-methyltransferase|nr:RsmE family RNA methyltransferase [Mycoplasmatota bacterium]